MIENIRVAVTGTDASLLVATIEKQHRELTVMQQGFDVAECVALAESGNIDAAIILGDTESLTLTIIERFHAHRVAVIVVSDDAAERQRCFQLGAECLGDSAETTEIVQVVVRSYKYGSFAPRNATDSDFADAHISQLDGPQSTSQFGDVPGIKEPAVEGKIYVFWGPMGSPGTSTLSFNAAAEFLLAGHKTLLIDADSYAASLAIMAGMLEESSSLSQLCRIADLGNLSAESFSQTVDEIEIQGKTLYILSGLPHASRWPELRTAALEQVFHTAREIFDVIIIDTAAPVEQDEELSFDVVVPQRNAATLCALNAADFVFAIGAADVQGMSRYLKHLPEVQELVGATTELLCVINKVSAENSGGQPKEQLLYTWQRFGPAQKKDLKFLPEEGNTLRKALMAGESLAEYASESVLRKALQEILELPITHSSRWWPSERNPRDKGRAKQRKTQGRRVKT